MKTIKHCLLFIGEGGLKAGLAVTTVLLLSTASWAAQPPTTTVPIQEKKAISAPQVGPQLIVPQKDLNRLRQQYGVEPKVIPLKTRTRGEPISSVITQVGVQPEGFGASLVWDRGSKEVLVIMFLNAADAGGISIHGLQKGDQIEVLAIAGLSSFSDGRSSPEASLIGLADIGGSVVAGIYAPELIPLIKEASSFAKKHFIEADAKRRDGYGQMAGKDEYARQEGGILVCLPESGGPYYSGNWLNGQRWVKKHTTKISGHTVAHSKLGRTDSVRPNHVNYGFFPIRHLQPRENSLHNTRTLTSSGTVYVVSWDHKFKDNTGHYKLEMRIRRGD